MKLRTWVQKGSQIGVTGHFRHLSKKRSPHGHHGDIGIIQNIRRSPLGRYLVAMVTEDLQIVNRQNWRRTKEEFSTSTQGDYRSTDTIRLAR